MNAVQHEWVIGRFDGEAADNVSKHANAGIGYFIQESAGAGKAKVTIAAFIRATDSPRPQHLEEIVDRYKIQRLEDLRNRRMGKVEHDG